MRVPPRLCAPASPSLSARMSTGIFWCLIFYRVDFFAREKGQGGSTTCQSLALVLTTPTTWPCRHRSGYPSPPPPHLAPIPSPLVVMTPSPSVETFWGVALEVGVTGAFSSHGRGYSVGNTKGWGDDVIFNSIYLSLTPSFFLISNNLVDLCKIFSAQTL